MPALPAQPGAEPTAHVLVVDDNDDMLLTTRALLERPGLEVLPARSAAEAMELLGRHDVALALLDVNMPVTDGFTLAEQMRDAERTREVPIIFLTGLSADAERTFRGYETGAVDFLIKPVHPKVLEGKVNAFVALFLQRKALRDQKADLERSFRVLRSLPADIWVTCHARWWGRYRKFVASATAQDPVQPFVDPEGYRAYIDAAEAELRSGRLH